MSEHRSHLLNIAIKYQDFKFVEQPVLLLSRFRARLHCVYSIVFSLYSYMPACELDIMTLNEVIMVLHKHVAFTFHRFFGSVLLLINPVVTSLSCANLSSPLVLTSLLPFLLTICQ